MSKTKQAFAQGKAFIPFLTAGDPDLEMTEQLILTMAEAGADLIEIGIPFSDPVAEGPVIQAADLRALSAGTTTDKIFAMVARVREKSQVPLALMTYMNPVYTYGVERFMAHCQSVGIDALIVPDVPYEEKAELADACWAYDVDLIAMVAPTSHERVKMIAAEAEGFLYCVSSLGVTGVRSQISTAVGEMIAQVKAVKDIPCAIGFGISTPEQAREMAAISDGASVGSAIVRIIAEHGRDSAPYVAEYVRQMKAAVSQA